MQFVHFIAQLYTRGLILLILAVAWMAGIVGEDALQASPIPFLLLSGLLLVLLIVFWPHQRDRKLLLILLFIGLGTLRCALAEPQNDPHSLQKYLWRYQQTYQNNPRPPSVNIRGTVDDEPKVQTRTRLLTISVNAIQTSKSSPWENIDGKLEAITLFSNPSADDPYGANYGDSVELQGKLQPPTPTSPKDVLATMSFPRIHISATGGNPILASIYHLRNRLAILIEQALPQPEAAILIAIFLGLRTPALQPLAQAFNKTGTTHMIVPSGFKVTIQSGVVARFTQPVLSEDTKGFPLTPYHRSWRDWSRAVLLLLSTALYTVLSGAGPAAQRAGIMGGLLIIAPRMGQNYNVYTALAAAAMLMSLRDPFVLWDVGFLLSFLGTLGIVLLTPYLQRPLQPIAKLPAGFLGVEMIAVSLAAQIATLPIMASAFHDISLISAIANTLTVPLLGPLIILGLAISITGLVLHPLVLFCGWVAYPFLWYVKWAITLCAGFPVIYVSSLDSFLAWSYYALLALATAFLLYRYPLSPTEHHPPLLNQRNRRLLYIGVPVLIIVITGTRFILPASTADSTVSFLNVDTTKANGQHIRGEAIFVRTQDGKTLLIDGGNDTSSLTQSLDGNGLLPSWNRSLDMVILTSPQQDTITGLTDVLTRYNVKAVYDAGMAHPSTAYARWRQVIKERNLPYKPVNQGTTIPLGAVTQLQVLWPQSTLHIGSNEVRDNGLILRLVMPGLRLLLLGSSIQSNYALTSLLNSVDGDMLKADIVQVLGEMNTPVPSALTNVLAQAQPSLVVVTAPTQHTKSSKSTATDNTRSTLSSALASVPQVWQTAQLGTFEIESDTNGWSMSE